MSSEEFLAELLREWKQQLEQAHDTRQWNYDAPTTLAFTAMMLEQFLQFYKREHRLGKRAPRECVQVAFTTCLAVYRLTRPPMP